MYNLLTTIAFLSVQIYLLNIESFEAHGGYYENY